MIGILKDKFEMSPKKRGILELTNEDMKGYKKNQILMSKTYIPLHFLKYL